MCDCDSDAPTLYRETNRTARKEHKCCECKRIITESEPYQHVVGVWDGEIRTFKTCAQCAAMRANLTYQHCAPCFTELGEAAYEAGIDFLYGDIR